MKFWKKWHLVSTSAEAEPVGANSGCSLWESHVDKCSPGSAASLGSAGYCIELHGSCVPNLVPIRSAYIGLS